MAVTKVATARANNGQTAGTTNATFTMPATAAVNDTAIFCLAENSTSGTFTAPLGWIPMRTAPDPSGTSLQAMLWKKDLVADDLLPENAQVTFTTSTGFRLPGQVVILRGTSASLVSAVAPTTVTTNGTAHTTPAVTTTIDQTWIEAFWVLRAPVAAPGPDLTPAGTHTTDVATKTAFAASPNVTLHTSHRTTPGAAGAYGGVSGTSSTASTSIVYSVIAAPAGAGPVASFTASTTSGVAPLTVNFTDTSTGSPTSRSWDFGDGSAPSTTTNPAHIYSSPGSYTVTLTASNSSGSSQATSTVEVTTPAVASNGLALFVNLAGVGWKQLTLYVNEP